MRIKKGDQVKIIKGKDRGKSGVILHVFPDEARVTVEGINLYKKRVRPKQQGQKGETVIVPRPLAISNVMLVCPNCKKPARVGFRTEGSGKNMTKTRICRKCGADI